MPENQTDTQVFTRLSVNINPETAAVLKRHKDEKGTSITETVRRAIALLDLVERHTAGGNEVLLKDQNGEVSRLLMV